MYYSSLQPYLSWWGVSWLTFFILINGFDTFFPPFNVSGFLTAYIGIPIYFAFFIGWKLFKRTKFWSLEEMDFWTGVPTLEETEGPYIPPTTFWGKVADILF